MTIRLVGANPGLTLRSTTGVTGYASVWRVDWSEQGAGSAIVMWHNGGTHVIGSEPELGRWLADEFNRHFPEVDGLGWPTPKITVAPVEMTISLERGMTAKAGDVTVEISDPMREPRPFRTAEFNLGGIPHDLVNVIRPFRTGRLVIGDTAVQGTPSAFVAEAEVWCRA